MANFLHGDKDMRSALHQNKGQGLSPSGQFIKEADRLAKLAKKAKVGGLVLTATGAAMSVAKMCAADTTYEKNVHLVKGAGAIAGGFAGDAGSKFLHTLYDQFGNQFDLASKAGIDKVCR